MSHFAQVIDGIVKQVIKAEQDFIDTLPDPKNWIQTSYNTCGGVHYAPDSFTPDNGVALRANYACIGDTYDSKNDVFYKPRPLDMNGVVCNSWTIGAPSWTWTAPIEKPPLLENGYYNVYLWDEVKQSWNLESSVKAPVTSGVQTA